MKRPTVLILIFLFISVSFVDGSEKKDLSREEMFFKANEAYKESRFEDAIKGYTRLINEGYKSGHLFYNLGNAYFRLNQLGYAVLNYERARLLIPRNGDLVFNLRYARDQTQDALPVDKDLISSTFFWLDSLNFNDLFWGLSVLNVLLFMTLMVRLFYKGEWTYYVFIVVLVFSIISGTSLGLKVYQIKTDDRAVLVKNEADILAGPDTQDTVLFKLHEGSIINHERSEDGWSLIRLSVDKRGWVNSQIHSKNHQMISVPRGK